MDKIKLIFFALGQKQFFFAATHMALIKKCQMGDISIIQAISTQKTLLFEYPAPFYGKNHRFPAFGDRQDSLKFVIKKFPDVDAVFISSSVSFGVFFLKNIKIYMTKPVFEQLLLKYEEYKSMCIAYTDLSICELDSIFCDRQYSKESRFCDNIEDSNHTKWNVEEIKHANDTKSKFDEEYQVVSLDDIRIEEFRKSVIILRYNHIVEYENFTIQPKPAGTFIGWCNYRITFDNKKTLLLLASYSEKRRFSIEASDVSSDYLIINRCKVMSENQILELSKYINEYVVLQTNRSLIIPVDFETFFIEIIFHILSLIEHSSVVVAIVFPLFKKLDFILNIQSEWLNKDFFSISEPFPLRKYRNLQVFNSFSEAPFGKNEKNIIFCSRENFAMLRNKMVLDSCEVLHIDHYFNKQNGYFGNNTGLPEHDINRDQASSTLIVPISPSPKNKKRSMGDYLPGIECDFSESNNKEELTETCFTIKIESTDDEILSNFKGELLSGHETYIDSERTVDSIYLDASIHMLEGKAVLSGTLHNTDFSNSGKIVKFLEDKPCFIIKIAKNEDPMFIDGWFYFLKAKMKIKLLNTGQIEYLYL